MSAPAPQPIPGLDERYAGQRYTKYSIKKMFGREQRAVLQKQTFCYTFVTN